MAINENRNEVKNTNDSLKTFFTILFPGIVIPYILTKKNATKVSIWKWIELPKKLLFLSVLSFSISSFLLAQIVKHIIVLQLNEINWFILAFYLFQIPVIPIVMVYRLKEIASDLSLGKLDMVSLPYIRNALIEFGFVRAKKISKAFQPNTPIFTKSGKSVVGINAHVKDYRFWRVRHQFPRQNILEDFIEDDLVLSKLDSSSPKHQLVIGETGSGKSRLLSRLALAGLAENWKVVIVDLKGGAEELQLYSNLGTLLPDRKIRVKRFPEQPFNIFNGSSSDIQKKMLSFLPPLTNTPSDFYVRRMMRGLKSVINENQQPPTSVEEILFRIKNGIKFGNSADDRHWFGSKLQGQTIADILEADIAQCLDPIRSSSKMIFDSGSSWDDSWDICVFSLDGSVRDDVLVGNAVLTDFDLHLKSSMRSIDNRNYLLIIDEAGVLNSIGGSPSLTSLISRSRSSGVGLVIASQTLLGLGAMGNEIAEATPIRWIGRLSNPQQMVDLVGTENVLEATYSYDEGNWHAPSAARPQKAYVVDPDLARRLETFYWNLSVAGSHLWVYAPPLIFNTSNEE